MKKILSTLLAVAMLLTLVVVATVNVVADDLVGDWTVWAEENEYAEDYEGYKKSIPGYKYTSEGFSTYGGDWKADSPYQLVQTKKAVDLKAGVYMEVRVDEFDYAASDKWLNLNIWRDANLAPGQNDIAAYGEGVQTLIRPTAVADSYGINGTVASVGWYTEGFTAAGSSAIEEANRTTVDGDTIKVATTDADGNATEVEVLQKKVVLTLSITWSAADGYTVTINGAKATDTVHTYMNEKFADGQGYIGFAMHSSAAGGKQACTITKFGTDANAKAPAGTDKADPVIRDNTVAEIADPNTVPAGKPAVLMTGDRANSALLAKPVSAVGSEISITEDNLIHVKATKGTADFGNMTVDKEVSYDVADFPVIMVLTKNLCTCGMGTYEDCLALESVSAYVMAGDVIAAEPAHVYRELDICYNPYLVEDAEGKVSNYLTFTLDVTGSESGRFNGIRVDAADVDLTTPGFNEYDMCWVGLFRSEDEAVAYAEEYLAALGWEGEEDTDDDETKAPEDETKAPEDETKAPEDETKAPEDETKAPEDETKAPEDETKAPEDETKAPAEDETKAPAAADKDDKDEDAADTTEEGGCGSFVGFGAFAVVAVAAVAGAVSFKKKED